MKHQHVGSGSVYSEERINDEQTVNIIMAAMKKAHKDVEEGRIDKYK